jgi:hypothetical protein
VTAEAPHGTGVVSISRSSFVVRQFGVLVQVLVEGLLAGSQALIAGQDVVDAARHRSAPCGPEKMARKNRNTFSTSRKIEAARKDSSAVGFSGGRVRVPGAWLAEWSHKHPSGAAPVCGRLP